MPAAGELQQESKHLLSGDPGAGMTGDVADLRAQENEEVSSAARDLGRSRGVHATPMVTRLRLRGC